MPYNEKTADRIRKKLAHLPNVEEKKMFGGLAFMVNAKMLICVSGRDEDMVMVRVGRDAYAHALKRKGAEPTVMSGRTMTGYIDLRPEAQKDLGYWIGLALDFNASLTAQGRGRVATASRTRGAKAKKTD